MSCQYDLRKLLKIEINHSNNDAPLLSSSTFPGGLSSQQCRVANGRLFGLCSIQSLRPSVACDQLHLMQQADRLLIDDIQAGPKAAQTSG